MERRLKIEFNIQKRRVKNILKYPKRLWNGRREIDKIFAQGPLKNAAGDLMSEADKENWKKALLHYNYFKFEEADIIARHLIEDNVRLVKDCGWENIPCGSPILICNVKDDLDRIKMLVNHHRKIGITYFAILDNGSKDGTLEWIMKQPDIDVYIVDEKYNSVVRAAWILKIAMRYGMNRWYVIVDSDELLIFEDMESKNIEQFIKELENKGIYRSLGFMIDMYARQSDLLNKSKGEDIFSKYCYFDTSSYRTESRELHPCIFGGPRNRFFGKNEEGITELLTKYPIYYWRKGEIYRYHFVSPFKENYSSPICTGLLHYKFLDGDMDRYQKIVQEGNYAGGSMFYKKYINGIDESGVISFMYDGSEKFRKSKDLEKINIYKPLKGYKHGRKEYEFY